MSRHRRLGVLFGLLGFVGLCVAGLVSPLGPDTGFAGLPGIEDDITDRAEAVLDGIDGATVDAEGRDLRVTLPPVIPAGTSRDEIRSQLLDHDGVRTLEMIGGDTIAVPDVPDTEPTATPEPAPEPSPTAVPAPEPTDEPEPAPEPSPTAEPEATEEPTPAPPPVQDPAEILDSLDAVIEFEPGTATLSASDTTALDGLSDLFLDLLPGVPVEIQVHTDNEGDPDVNLLLSQDRAEAVTDYLIDRGVDPALLTPRGYGASQPIADNSTEQGRAANSRVAFVVEGI